MSKIFALLQEFPTEEHVQGICKFQQGEATCRYLALNPEGLHCVKASILRETLDERVKDGDIRSRGDNCDGPLGVIIANKPELVGNSVKYTESMPSISETGTLRDILVESNMVHVVGDWPGDNYDRWFNEEYLEITVSPSAITFGAAGLGAFAGQMTIYL